MVACKDHRAEYQQEYDAFRRQKLFHLHAITCFSRTAGILYSFLFSRHLLLLVKNHFFNALSLATNPSYTSFFLSADKEKRTFSTIAEEIVKT